MKRSDRPARKIFSLVACTSVALLAVGCEVDQKKEIAAYRAVLDGPEPSDYAYRRGSTLSLQAAILLANRSDEQLASSGEDYVQALIDKERQFSTFLPTLSVAPIYEWTNHPNGGNHNQNTWDVPAVGSYNVFNGFQDVANYRRSGYTAGQRKALLLDLQQTILLNVAQTYYSILTSERSVAVLLNSVELQNARVRDMEGRAKAGLARPLDVAQSKAQAAATRVQLIQAQNNVRTGRIALAFLTATPVQDAPLEDRINVPENIPSQDELTLAAERTRQDVQASEAAVQAARQSVQAAIGEYYPSVSLNLDYFLQKASAGAPLWESLLQANIPIFTAGQIDANVRTAWSQLRQAWLNQQRTHRLVSEQVRTACENIRGSRSRLHDLIVEVAAARDSLDQARFSYGAGLATNLDVLTAIDQFNSAELSLASEQFNYKIYYLQLLRSQGVLTQAAGPAALSAPTTLPATQPADSR